MGGAEEYRVAVSGFPGSNVNKEETMPTFNHGFLGHQPRPPVGLQRPWPSVTYAADKGAATSPQPSRDLPTVESPTTAPTGLTGKTLRRKPVMAR
jgi:hypothetical protein